MASSSLVHFDGDWTTRERDLVLAAAEDAEASDLPPPAESMGAPWVATRQTIGDSTLYMASRQQGESALMDQSAEGLADRIRTFANRQGTPDAPSLFQLVYKSTEAESMTEPEIRHLLQEARTKNERLGITGLLLYAEGQFLQVLEGPESAVRSLYDTIREDSRHTNVETLVTTRIPERTFPDWGMTLEQPDIVADEDAVSGYLQTGDLPAADPIAEVAKVLERFRTHSPQK